jgi:hypothetical protein
VDDVFDKAKYLGLKKRKRQTQIITEREREKGMSLTRMNRESK